MAIAPEVRSEQFVNAMGVNQRLSANQPNRILPAKFAAPIIVIKIAGSGPVFASVCITTKIQILENLLIRIFLKISTIRLYIVLFCMPLIVCRVRNAILTGFGRTLI